MTEDEAKAWIVARYNPEKVAKLDHFATLVAAENARQNLVAPSTLAMLWSRHIVDSAQLLGWDRRGELWCDIGTGGGFPGMVVAILRDDPVVMVEPRTRRAAFLSACIDSLGLAHAQSVTGKVERWSGQAGIISARAVASLDALFASARHCAGVGTRWILPKGRTAHADVDQARSTWRGMFHVEQSIVEPDGGIVIVEGLARR